MYFKPAPYFVKHNWVMIEDITKMRIFEWNSFVRKSYDSVFHKLSEKKNKEIGPK